MIIKNEKILENEVSLNNSKYDLHTFGLDKFNIINKNALLSNNDKFKSTENPESSTINEILSVTNIPTHLKNSKENLDLTDCSLKTSNLTKDFTQEFTGVVCMKLKNFAYVYFYEFFDEMEIDLEKFSVELGEWIIVIMSM